MYRVLYRSLTLAALALALLSTSTIAQPRVLAQRCLGGSGEDAFPTIISTRDGGYMVMAMTGSNDGDVRGNHGSGGYRDIWLIKMDRNGKEEWSHCYGGSRNDEGSGIVEAPGGGYLFVGSTVSVDGDVKGWHTGVDGYNQNQPDMWVVRINSVGEIVWQRCLGGTGNDAARSVCRAHDGGYVVAGAAVSRDGDVKGQHNNQYGWGDGWIVKISEAGAIEWQNTLGGTGHDHFSTITATPDGGYIVAGSTSSDDGDAAGNHRGTTQYANDLWVVKLNGGGRMVWRRCLGGTRFEDPAFLHRIVLRKEGGYILTSRTNSLDGDVAGGPTPDPNYTGQTDGWVVWLDSTGAIQHQRRLGGTEMDDLSGIVPLPNGDLIVTGSTSTKRPVNGEPLTHYDGWMVRFDTARATLWDARLGGSDLDDISDAIVLNDSTLVVVGATRSNDGNVSGLHTAKDGGPSWDVWLATVAIDYTREEKRPLLNSNEPTPGGAILSGIAVTPNPTYGPCTLVLPASFQGDVAVEVISPNGKVMFASRFPDAGSRLPLDLGNLPPDTYTVAVTRGTSYGVAEVTLRR